MEDIKKLRLNMRMIVFIVGDKLKKKKKKTIISSLNDEKRDCKNIRRISNIVIAFNSKSRVRKMHMDLIVDLPHFC